MKKHNQNGFAMLSGLLILLIVVAAGAAGWYVWRQNNGPKSVNSYEECLKAGNPIQESYPEVCRDKKGKSFTNTNQKTHLEIKEWGVKSKLPNLQNENITYTFDESGALNLINQKIRDYQRSLDEKYPDEDFICDHDSLISRYKTENAEPDPFEYRQFGQYTYYVLPLKSACVENQDAEAEAAYIRGEKSRLAKDFLDNLSKL